MPSLPVVHITGPNGEQVPVKCDPPPAPKPTKTDDGFDADEATLDELWAYVVEKTESSTSNTSTPMPQGQAMKKMDQGPSGV
ncbi:hypothetical protein CEP54_009346 [Fusarium duplospermum]|uniref:Uncharacterized protein n=1 Tax=Fusarium duplospermum TaxID=1325734 RepID=A0A428PR19_9HYPO|nr:hypothetical protein CEP54_009346 [Fusarium duplospermum]